MKKIFDELPKQIFSVTNLRPDSRFNNWCKWIDSVDQNGKDGYAIGGDFISGGTIEVEIEKPRLILACTTEGSMKYHHRYFAVAKMDKDGNIADLNIRTEDSTPGWFLRIRQALVDALGELV